MGEERGERTGEKQECRRGLEQKEEVGDKEDRGRDSSVSHVISPEDDITSCLSERAE